MSQSYKVGELSETPKTGYTALIDADILLYKVGFHFGDVLLSSYTYESYLRELLYNIMVQSGCDSYKLVLSGRENFRMDIATIKIYKGNRKGKSKPVGFYAIKCVMLEQFKAHIFRGEADDSICSCLHKKVVACSIDKDFLTVPGLHYNWDTDRGHHRVTPHQSMCNLLGQMIVGDTCDNIQGVFRKGVKCKEYMAIGTKPLVESMIEIVGMYPSDMEAEENLQLLWIKHPRQKELITLTELYKRCSIIDNE